MVPPGFESILKHYTLGLPGNLTNSTILSRLGSKGSWPVNEIAASWDRPLYIRLGFTSYRPPHPPLQLRYSNLKKIICTILVFETLTVAVLTTAQRSARYWDSEIPPLCVCKSCNTAAQVQVCTWPQVSQHFSKAIAS